MDKESQALFLNAVPLLALASLYLAATAALLPAFWRERARVRDVEFALALVFPCGGAAAAIVGVLVLLDREPMGGNAWLGLAAVLLALGPGLAFFARWHDRGLLLTGSRRLREAEELTTRRAQERDALAGFAVTVARAADATEVARLLVREVTRLLGVEFASLVRVDGSEASGLAAVLDGEDVDWWPTLRLDLEREPSAIASTVFEAAPLSVYDVESSTQVSASLAARVGAKSAAFVPLLSGDAVCGVLGVATTRERRAFTSDELSLLTELAAEASLALGRTGSAAALAAALERERLVARITKRLRAELDVDALLRVAVEETGAALGVARALVRLEGTIAAEWDAPDVVPVGQHAERLPAANLAARERRTVAIADVRTAAELADPALGGRETLLELDANAVLATPIAVFDNVIGVFALHRREPWAWTADEVALAEAVAHEVGLAVHTVRLLEQNERRVEQHAALVEAAQAVTSELAPDAVLQRLVDEVAQLLRAEAADCYLLERDSRVLRCAAVHGLPRELVGFEFPADRGLSGAALAGGRAVAADDYLGSVRDPVPHDAYASFAHALVAPVVWAGEARAVLGVGTADARRSFDDGDAEILEAFASLAALALRNAEVFEERSRQARVQRGFYRIASVLGQPLSRAETLDAVAQAAAEALGGSFAAVLMQRRDGLELEGAQELPGELRDALAAGLPSDGALATAAADGRVLAARSLAADDRFGGEWRALAERVGFASLLAIPLRGRDDETGVVAVFFERARRFSDDDLDLAQQLAGAARGALERSALFEQERTARALAQQLARTGGLLATELDPAAVLDEVVRQAPRLVGADACAIRVIEGDELVVSAAEGEGVDAVQGSRSPATAWLSGDVVQSRAPVPVEDAASDPRLRATDPLLALGYRAYLGVPLAGPEGALHGVLAVYASRRRTWRPEEIEALEALAANASAALSNAELYQRVAIEKERSFAILANIADGIVAVDRDGRVVLWNNAAEQITGVPQEEAVGRTPLQVLGRNLESDGDAGSGDRLVSILRSGEEVWLSLTEAIMRDPAGAVAGRIYAFRDISADRLVEQMKSDFVSTVSQELRRPLTSIYGFAETLLRRDVNFGEEERRTFLGYIASESERLTALVDKLLNVARLESGDMPVTLAPTDVGSVVHDVVESVEAAGTNGHRFVVDLPDEPIAAEADADKLRQVLAQLVDNAVKFSPGGGTITVGARRASDTIEVSVADEGIGIPRAQQQRIFRKFTRGDGGGSSAGIGLGLFMAQGLVSAMGGRISLASTEGAGSRFTVELPAALDPAGQRV